MRARMRERGFSLIELGMVLVLVGIVLAVAIPAIKHSTSASSLRAGADGLAMQIHLAREKAVDMNVDLVLRFAPDSLDSDFHVRESDGSVSGRWSLPPGISYTAQSGRGFTIKKDGRASTSIYIILMDRDGRVDTVSVQSSGMVVVS